MALRDERVIASEALFLLLFVCCAGCALDNPAVLRDTTGAEMGWECERGHCTTVRESFSPLPPTECGEDAELLVGAGKLAILCVVSAGDIVHERTCRPLACLDELDCPQWEERTYTCASGICETDDPVALDRIDVAALCLSEVPRHTSCADAENDPRVDERIALRDSVCDETRCESVPSECLSP